MGLFASIFPIGGIVGPILGGVFVTYWSWRGIFLVNIPIGIALICLGFVVIPDIARRPDRHLDIRGVVLLGSTLLSAMLGIAYLGGADGSALSADFIVPECVAVAAGVAFVRHTARAVSPFISLRFLTGRGFGVMNLLNFLYGSTVLGFAAADPAVRRGAVRASRARGRHAADRPRSRHDRHRRPVRLPAAPDRLPVADQRRLRLVRLRSHRHGHESARAIRLFLAGRGDLRLRRRHGHLDAGFEQRDAAARA